MHFQNIYSSLRKDIINRPITFACILGNTNETGRITLIPIAVNLSEDTKVDSYGQVPLSADALMTVCSSQPPPNEPFHSAGNKPKKTGSLALFFRKVECICKYVLY